MPTSRTAHAERQRENTLIKQHQGKAWATKAQQDVPANVAINSQLLRKIKKKRKKKKKKKEKNKKNNKEINKIKKRRKKEEMKK
jgi:hypothetical protein